jgi:thiol:disulfide interchange protein
MCGAGPVWHAIGIDLCNMKRIIAISITLWFLSSHLHAQDTLAAPARDTLSFRTGDPALSIAQAKKEKKLLLMDFWADWCLPCKQMDRLTFSDSLVMMHLRRNYVLHRVDVSQFAGMDVAEARKVDKYPTMIVLDRKGMEAGRMMGFQSADSLLYKLKRWEVPPPKKGKR